MQAVIDRYNLLPPPELTEEQMYAWQQRKGIPVRLRVSNFIKTWLEAYWRPASDAGVLPLLSDFNQDALATMFPKPAERIRDMIRLRTEQLAQQAQDPSSPVIMDARHGREQSALAAAAGLSAVEHPRPVVAKALLAGLRRRDFGTVVLTDFDTLELARQCHGRAAVD